MARWLTSLQKPGMYEATKNVMIVWSFLCALYLIVDLSMAADMNNLVVRQFTKVMTLHFWTIIWAYPVAGLGIIAFITRPRAAATKAR